MSRKDFWSCEDLVKYMIEFLPDREFYFIAVLFKKTGVEWPCINKRAIDSFQMPKRFLEDEYFIKQSRFLLGEFVKYETVWKHVNEDDDIRMLYDRIRRSLILALFEKNKRAYYEEEARGIRDHPLFCLSRMKFESRKQKSIPIKAGLPPSRKMIGR